MKRQRVRHRRGAGTEYFAPSDSKERETLRTCLSIPVFRIERCETTVGHVTDWTERVPEYCNVLRLSDAPGSPPVWLPVSLVPAAAFIEVQSAHPDSSEGQR